jgi:hypothetical protein
MALFRRAAVLAGAAQAAVQYAKRNPEKVNKLADGAARFIDKQTHGRYHDKIDSAVRRVRQATGSQHHGRA